MRWIQYYQNWWWRFGTGLGGASSLFLIVHCWNYDFLSTPCCMMMFMMSTYHYWLFLQLLLKIHMLLSLCYELSMMHKLHIMILWMIAWIMFSKFVNWVLSLLKLEEMYAMLVVDVVDKFYSTQWFVMLNFPSDASKHCTFGHMLEKSMLHYLILHNFLMMRMFILICCCYRMFMLQIPIWCMVVVDDYHGLATSLLRLMFLVMCIIYVSWCDEKTHVLNHCKI